MTNHERRNSPIRRVGLALGLSLLLTAATEPTMALAKATLSPQEQSQAAALVAKLLDIAKSLSPGSSEGAYEGAFADALSGYSPAAIEAALAQIAGTPGLPVNALAAARRLDIIYAQNGANTGTGAIGGLGATPLGFGGPGFTAGGGGGSNYTQ
jgi:hypothetical protein